jgi:VCBS repeat-containing protein
LPVGRSIHFVAVAVLLSLALIQSGCVGLTGADSSGQLVFSPAKVNFGDVVAGTKKTQTVTLTNSGTEALTLPQATVAGSSYTLTGLKLPVTIDPGATVTFTASFTPTTTGPSSGTIVVSSDNPALQPEALALSGMGLSASGPTITSQPANQSVTIGQSATFSVSATGTDPLSYQWKKNNSNISGATAATYTTPSASSSDSGAVFTATITDAVGSVTSAPATLTVTATPLAPTITSQPANRSVTAGQSATFSVTVSGTSPLSYQWRKNGAVISGATGVSYTTPATTSADNGAQFSVIVLNAVGSVTSSAATLTVSTPVTITSQPGSLTVVAGQTATFAVTATGSFSIGYQWRKNGVNIAGATAASYTTPTTVTADNGAQFTVVVTSSAGSVVSNAATLTVTSAPVAPSITTQPASRTVAAGQTASFTVAATGTSPISYQWRKNGVNIPGATAASYTAPATTSADNGAQFTVVVTNSVNTVTSNAATLTVNTPVTITSQPADQSVTAGQTASFSVTATGTAPLSYQWRKNGAAIGGATAATYTMPAAVTADNGALFSVVVSNTASSATSNSATLDVTAAPVAPSITSQPANRSVATGQPATFSVTATGTAPMSYQWRKNGAAISGATAASYTTPATTSGDDGSQFSVVVSNALGNLASNAATLTVIDPPAITGQPVSTSVLAGQTGSFSVTATGDGTLSYQWKKNGANISGATAAGYTTPATVAGDDGAQFTVVVSNSVGTVTSGAATLTVSSAPSITSQPGNRTVVAGQTASFSVTATGTAPLSYQWRKNGAAIGGATAASYTTPATTTADNGALFSVLVSNSVGSATSNAGTLTVNAATQLLTASPSTLNFGSVAVGSTKTIPVTISNSGNSNISINNIALSGPGFSPSGVGSGLTLTPGQTATLNVTFDPAGAGAATGSVSVSSNATNSPASITLSGTGVQPVQHSVTVSWIASPSAGAKYFTYRGAASGGPYTKLNSTASPSISYTDSTVQAGSTYFYVVTAVDSGGVESNDSNQAQAIVPTP